MPNTVTIRTIVDSPDFNVTHVYILGDGSGEETNKVVVDASALAGANPAWQVWEYSGLTRGFTAKLNFDQTTPSVIAISSDAVQFDYQWNPTYPQHHPIFNPAGTGSTGDLTLTTTGLGAGDEGVVVITCSKKRTSFAN